MTLVGLAIGGSRSFLSRYYSNRGLTAICRYGPLSSGIGSLEMVWSSVSGSRRRSCRGALALSCDHRR